MNWLRQMISWRKLDGELSEEIRQHLEEKVEELVASGMSRKEAGAAARREFGNVTLIEEDSRGVWRWPSIENFLTDIRHGLRMLRKNPGFTAAVVITLALGMGASTSVFAVVEAVLLRPLPYTDADRLMILKHRDMRTGITKEFIAIGDFLDLSARQSTFESVAAYGQSQATVFDLGEPFRVDALWAGPGLFDTLRARPALGRALQPADSRPQTAPVMLLGYDLWLGRFGSDPHIIGRSVKVDQQTRQVVGIAPPGFHFPPNSRSDVILPINIPPEAPAKRKSDWTFAVARLASRRSNGDAAANLSMISRQLEREFPQSNQGSEYYPVPLREAVVGDTKPALVLLLVSVGVVLLIACANVGNLFLARSLARHHEMAVRMALGAGRSRLVAQLLTESLVLALAAGLVGTVAAHWSLRGIVALVPKTISAPGFTDVHVNGGVVAFALGLCAGSALISGLASAITLRREQASGVLATSRVTMGALARRAASALVVAEMALAIILLVGAGLLIRSFTRLMAVDTGFHVDRVMTVDIKIPADRYRDSSASRAFYDRAFGALKGLEDVQEVGAAVVTPLTGNNWTVGFERADQPLPQGERPPEVGWQLASGGYFRALQIPLRAGRLFDERDRPGSKPVVIVSEAIQRRFFPNESAVGRAIKLGNDTVEIIGVVGDIRRADLRDEPRADVCFPFERLPDNQITLFVRTAGDPTRALPAVKLALQAIEPDIVVLEARSMADVLSDSVQVTRLALNLLSGFALMALALGAVGIYGVMSYVIRERTHEIGTRVTLGARPRDIVWLVMRQGALIAVSGTTIGLAVGLGAARFLESMLYGTSVADPGALSAAVLILVTTAMVACCLPARRAARVDPMVALRYE